MSNECTNDPVWSICLKCWLRKSLFGHSPTNAHSDAPALKPIHGFCICLVLWVSIIYSSLWESWLSMPKLNGKWTGFISRFSSRIDPPKRFTTPFTHLHNHLYSASTHSTFSITHTTRLVSCPRTNWHVNWRSWESNHQPGEPCPVHFPCLVLFWLKINK